jgi:hypothetical protein
MPTDCKHDGAKYVSEDDPTKRRCMLCRAWLQSEPQNDEDGAPSSCSRRNDCTCSRCLLAKRAEPQNDRPKCAHDGCTYNGFEDTPYCIFHICMANDCQAEALTIGEAQYCPAHMPDDAEEDDDEPSHEDPGELHAECPATVQAEQALGVDLVKHPGHYTKGIECWDFITSQNLGFIEGNVVKYVVRYKHKNGLQDLLKARQYLEKLISLNGGEPLTEF